MTSEEQLLSVSLPKPTSGFFVFIVKVDGSAICQNSDANHWQHYLSWSPKGPAVLLYLNLAPHTKEVAI